MKVKIDKMGLLFVVFVMTGCLHENVTKWDNGKPKYVIYSKGKQTVRDEEYREDGTLNQVIYIHKGTDENDSVRRFDSLGIHKITLYYNPPGTMDSMVSYYKNGKCMKTGSIFRFDTVPCDWDTGPIVKDCEMTVPSGYEIDYWENGKKKSEGPIVKGKEKGEWKYYDSLGSMTMTDTL